MKLQKIIVVLGTTSTGKSELAVYLAKKFDGEIISADSRQVYKDLDIGTGKITEEEMGGIPHHLLDLVDTKEQFSVADYRIHTDKAINNILYREKIPIIAGGTGFYIQSVVDNIVPLEVPANEELRQKLSKKTEGELLRILEKLDLSRAETVDQKNKRRLIRAIEIAKSIGRVPKLKSVPLNYTDSKYNVLQIGLKLFETDLRIKIQERVRKRLNAGWIEEVQYLIDSGVESKRFSEFGLGYSIIYNNISSKIYSNVLQNIGIDFIALTENIVSAEWKYAKQQKKWFKRDKRIRWFSPDDTIEIEAEVKKFLES